MRIRWTRRGLQKLLGIAALLLMAMPLQAAAQGFELQQFHPMPGQKANLFTTSAAQVPSHMDWSALLILNYGNDPLVWRNEEGERIESVVGHQGTANILASMGLFGVLEVGIDLPVHFFQQGSPVTGIDIRPEDGGFGVGDLRLVPKVQLFSARETRDANGGALAVVLDMHLPTGSDERLQGGDFRIGPRIAFDAVVGGPRLAANLGYLYRSENEVGNLDVRDMVRWNVGVEVPVGDQLWITTEMYGRLTPAAEEMSRAESPTEWLTGAKMQLGELFFVGGMGLGLVNGYGTPDWRMFLGLGFATPDEPPPPPEPTPEPECRQATVEADCGEPPPANCGDGILYTYSAACIEGSCEFPVTQTPCAAGTICGEEGGVAACVPEPDCYEDGDCTDLPATTCEDGVVTSYVGQCREGECHYEPVQTPCEEGMECGLEGGVPACVPEPELVEVDEEEERIDIHEVVHFALDSAEIEERSFGLLDQVAQVLYNNSHLTRIRIEGHTDDTGERAYNLDLSQRRAESVRNYLIEYGIDEARLHAVGFGPDEPIADNATPQGRQQNRRVEFHIEERQ